MIINISTEKIIHILYFQFGKIIYIKVNYDANFTSNQFKGLLIGPIE